MAPNPNIFAIGTILIYYRSHDNDFEEISHAGTDPEHAD